MKGKDVDIRPIEQEHVNGLVQEHVELIKSGLGKMETLNRAKQVADSTLCAIGGRISAYTGQPVRWVDLTVNTKSPIYSMELAPGPLDFERGNVKMPPEVPTLPGEEGEFRIR